MQINQQLVRFNRVLTKEINKKVLKTLSVRKPFFSECYRLFSECRQSINRQKVTLILTKK